MNEQLDNQLCEKYPKIFANRIEDVENSCMVFGFDVDDGWFNIVDRLCHMIQSTIDGQDKQIESIVEWNTDVERGAIPPWWSTEHNGEFKKREVPEPIPQVVATQVKEKFGSLRFYFTGGNDQIHNYTRMAESMSGVTCEQCGAPGVLSGKSWVRVLCEQHTKERDEKIKLRD